MKKLIALTMVCGFAFAFASCGGAATTETTETETAPMDTVMAVDTLESDTAVADSTGAM